ncbi:YidB family protein [Acinetobacter sp. HY1485]|uniref:YidB family protein n=1 Tax=Acinetobacter sp. HY1485 TaxID=2970918 RepID=UPI0022B9CE1E|nr:YidB family protein [Acinetobacter sp. HY1485]
MTDLTNIVEALAKQALGGSQNSQGGLGGMLGSVLGQLGQNQNQQSNNSGLGGMLGSVVGSVLGGNNNNTTSGGAQSLLVAVVPLILSWIQQQGGLQAALDKLRGAGLTNQVQSWVDPEQANSEKVSTDHMEGLFNEQDVQQVADQTQSTTQAVYGAISSVLPQIVDALTPKGEDSSHQEANADIQKVLGMVSSFLK